MLHRSGRRRASQPTHLPMTRIRAWAMAGTEFEEVASVQPLPASASESQKMRTIGNRSEGGRGRRGSRWTIPIAILCVAAAAGFIGFVIYIINHQAQMEVANSRTDNLRSDNRFQPPPQSRGRRRQSRRSQSRQLIQVVHPAANPVDRWFKEQWFFDPRCTAIDSGCGSESERCLARSSGNVRQRSSDCEPRDSRTKKVDGQH